MSNELDIVACRFVVATIGSLKGNCASDIVVNPSRSFARRIYDLCRFSDHIYISSGPTRCIIMFDVYDFRIKGLMRSKFRDFKLSTRVRPNYSKIEMQVASMVFNVWNELDVSSDGH